MLCFIFILSLFQDAFCCDKGFSNQCIHIAIGAVCFGIVVEVFIWSEKDMVKNIREHIYYERPLLDGNIVSEWQVNNFSLQCCIIFRGKRTLLKATFCTIGVCKRFSVFNLFLISVLFSFLLDYYFVAFKIHYYTLFFQIKLIFYFCLTLLPFYFLLLWSIVSTMCKPSL